MSAAQLVQQMHGTLIKDKADDVKKLAHYMDVVARERQAGKPSSRQEKRCG